MTPLRVAWRAIWTLAALSSLPTALVWWWLFPGGFPVDHSRFWIHRGGPFALAALALATTGALWTNRPRLAATLIAMPAGAWCGATAAACVLYPMSARIFALPMILGGLVLLAFTIVSFAPRLRQSSVWLAAGAVPAALAGLVLSVGLRAVDPATRPLGDGGTVDAAQERAEIAPLSVGPVQVAVDPALRFASCSPDRFMTLFTPHACGGASATQSVTRTTSSGAIEIDAVTRVPAPVYSHLNSFLTLAASRLRGTPSISFPCAGDTRVQIRAGQYPFGAPYRLAYLGADGMFRVVEAYSGEKGPFTELAGGPLERGAPLSFTLWDDARPFLDVTLHDWSTQASTQLSPTAGWGLPENSLQLDREGDRIFIYVTLASTSVGRGFDSVGHAPGAYRNRVRLTPR